MARSVFEFPGGAPALTGWGWPALVRKHGGSTPLRFQGKCTRTLLIISLLAGTAGGQTFTGQYCAGCHNARLKSGGLVLEGLDPVKADAQPEIWEKVIRKVRAGAMPPQGAARPPAAAVDSFVGGLEAVLDRRAKATPDPGRPLLHRMNRAEYANAIRDLLDLEIDAAAYLPPDDSAYGFDNVSDVLGVSPALQERYLSAASAISAMAVGDTRMSAGGTLFRIRQDLSQNQHIEGMPLGTRGGIRVRYHFPVDGEYVLQAKLLRTNLNIMRGLEFPHEVEFAVDGERVHAAKLGGTADLASLFDKPTETGDDVDGRLRARIRVKAGTRDVTAAFLQGPEVAGPDRLQAFLRSSADNFDWAGWPHLQTFSITGPFAATGSGDTASRRRIFTCRPSASRTDAACAREILGRLARLAYRQPVSGADLDRILTFYETGKKDGGFEQGIQMALERILASPKFAFRGEIDAALGSVVRVSDLELASRLSFFLWSSIPDDELLRVAAQGRLKGPAMLESQVRRMLADPKARALVANFAGQWLHLRNVRNILPNSDLFPDFDDNLRQAFLKETEMFFTSVLREDRSVLDLLTADYTFVNERLARHYGIPGIHGSQFRRVTLRDENRRGLLGKGSILSVTSHAERTSPVSRGKWILENLLGMAVPPPPPNVPPLPESKENPRTMREQMAAHRANAVCASCHKIMDPAGLALENFDAIGAWRSEDAGEKIDASGELLDGTKVDGVAGLRAAIAARPEQFAGNVTEKLLIYALGRGVDYRDMPAVRAVVQDAAKSQYRFSSLILGVVRSTPFQFRKSGT